MMMIPVLVLYCHTYIYIRVRVSIFCVRKAYLGEADIPQNNPINTYVRAREAYSIGNCIRYV
ncbi:unnamed protein product [Brassica oleracea var. botrytis]